MRKNKDLFSIFPADAGVNLGGTPDNYDGTNIPRGCGGEPWCWRNCKSNRKYSPRMRG